MNASTPIHGIVFDILKFAIHDGPGIRTTVFLKGCPLNCLWCHNPESKDARVEISYLATKCVGCGACVAACTRGCHRLTDGMHIYDRTACVRCGGCAENCYARAIEQVGRPREVGEVLAEVLRDRPFYETSGGGMTISGGEPMAQFEFTRELLARARAEGLHTALDTCGFAPQARYAELLPLVDLFLYDIKTTNPDRHRELTGRPLDLIHSNLRFLSGAGARIFLRCPLVPGVNDSDAELAGIAVLASELEGVEEVNVEPYHPLGVSKTERMGYAEGYSAPIPPPEYAQKMTARIAALTAKTVRRS
ncbi:MAG: glycyl-radical enzyme activating protein [Lentisphaerae bacterium]|jgi:pyruvate formate lyase activating enzyme|nr:glycyl-radical enzyme activating protein [Lentisphaerota bacterium]